ncbi:MAG: glycosyltransferase family 2 protein [Clostridia bacterium]
MDKISVIVPVYNVEKYLNRCVESIIKQTYKNLEIILIDDGSPDNCGQLCEQFKTQDNRIKVYHKKNEGLGLTRNLGLKEATGNYITFVDSDDWIGPQHIENMYLALCNNSADLCIGGHTRVDQNGNQVVCKVKLTKEIYLSNEIENEILLPLIGPDAEYPNDIAIESSCCMNMYKINVIKENNIEFISERYAVAEDLYYNIDFLHYASKVVTITDSSYFYFENLGSISRKYDEKRFQRTLKFYEEIKIRIKKYNLENKINYRLDRSYITKIRVAIRHIVNSNLKTNDKIKQIENIINHEITIDILQKYPIEKYIPAMRILIKLMKSRNAVGIYYLMKTRETAKKTTVIKNALKCLGIGK